MCKPVPAMCKMHGVKCGHTINHRCPKVCFGPISYQFPPHSTGLYFLWMDMCCSSAACGCSAWVGFWFVVICYHVLITNPVAPESFSGRQLGLSLQVSGSSNGSVWSLGENSSVGLLFPLDQAIKKKTNKPRVQSCALSVPDLPPHMLLGLSLERMT